MIFSPRGDVWVAGEGRELGMESNVYQGVRTDTDCKGEESETSQGVLDKEWPAGTEESGTGAVILTVVCGVEAVYQSQFRVNIRAGIISSDQLTFRRPW
jgi:hypothetical protein